MRQGEAQRGGTLIDAGCCDSSGDPGDDKGGETQDARCRNRK